MVRIPTVSFLTVVSILLLVLGGLATFWTFAWWVEAGYDVSVSAPDNVTWTLWVPHHGIPMPWTTRGSVVVVGPTLTPYGTLLNITGMGPGQVRFSTTAIGFDPDPIAIAPGINLTSREGPWPTGIYHIWRQSSDPSANVSLAGALPFAANRLGESWSCGGGGFVGYPAEDWNALPIAFGDCVATTFAPPDLIPAILLVPGAVLAARSGRRGHGGSS